MINQKKNIKLPLGKDIFSKILQKTFKKMPFKPKPGARDLQKKQEKYI